MRRRRLLLSGLAVAVVLAGVDACGDRARPPASGRRPDDGHAEGRRRNPGGGPPPVYRGAHQREVRYLLRRSPAWRASADARTDTGLPPRVRVGSRCTRDGYVASAVQFAWAAESYYRLSVPVASEMAVAARRDLDRADQLCGDTLAARPEDCRTAHLWGCPPPW